MKKSKKHKIENRVSFGDRPRPTGRPPATNWRPIGEQLESNWRATGEQLPLMARRPRTFKHLYLFAVKFQLESLIKLLK